MKHSSFVFLVASCGLLLAPTAALATTASYLVTSGTVTQTDKSYSSSTADTSAVGINGTGRLTLLNCAITTSGNTSSTDNSSFYGLNAGILVDTGGTLVMTGGSVTTSGTGANGIFAYGTGVGYVTDVTVDCTAQAAHAVMCSGGGTLTVSNLVANTAGTNSGAIATDRGGGTIYVTGGTIRTTGKDSPAIYSTDVVSVTNATLTATASEAVVIEGKNQVDLANCTLSGGVSTYGGIMMMQSMSGDADEGTSKVNMTGCSMTVNAGPAFFVTNNSAEIYLTDSAITNSSEAVLINAAATTRWGTIGSNGGTATLVAIGETLSGAMTADSISSIDAELLSGTTYTGMATGVAMTIDASSRWNVSGASTLETLDTEGTLAYVSLSNAVTVTGKATLGGKLVVTSPEAGTYTLLTAGSISGEFDSVETENTTAQAFALSVSYTATSVILTVTE